MARFAARARSAFYVSAEDSRTLGTADAFVHFGREAPEAARIWLEAVKRVTREEIEGIIREVPPKRMSEVTRRFTLELVMVNQERLLKL